MITSIQKLSAPTSVVSVLTQSGTLPENLSTEVIFRRFRMTLFNPILIFFRNISKYLIIEAQNSNSLPILMKRSEQ